MAKRAVLVISLILLGAWTGMAATLAVPSGTIFNCRLSQTLSTASNTQGQLFAATLIEPLIANGSQIVPAGATIRGRIASLSRPGRIKGVGKMLLVPETLALPNGQTFPINAVLLHAYGAPGVLLRTKSSSQPNHPFRVVLFQPNLRCHRRER